MLYKIIKLKKMEVYNITRRQLSFQTSSKFKSTKSFGDSNQLRKVKASKTQTLFPSFSKSRLRRLNSIQDNIRSLFKQNQSKFELFLKADQDFSDIVSSSNLQNLQIFSVLSDDIYVLIQGSIKMITFDQNRLITKNNSKQITNNIFRKLRINKEVGLRPRDAGSQHIKKYLINQNSDQYFTIATFEQPFSVFQCVNDNCLCFSTDTVVYRLDQMERKEFRYFQNKQKILGLLSQNRKFFKNHSMLYNTFINKKFTFRNQFKVDTVAIIRKGTLKVYKYNNSDKQNIKKMICQLGESNLLVKDYEYQISSHEADIIFIKNNQTFQFIQNPDWVSYYQNSQQLLNNQDGNRNQYKKKTKLQNLRKKFKHASLNNSILYHPPVSIQMHEKDIKFQQNMSFQNFCKNTQIDFSKKKIDRKSKTLENFWENNQNINNKKVESFAYNSPNINKANYKNFSTLKNKKIQFLKLISPYILISQNMGMKQISKTRKILNDRSLNISPQRNTKQQRINKLSKTKFNFSKHSFVRNQNRENQININKGNTLLRFEKYLQQKNFKQYKQKVEIFNKNSLSHHKKSYSQLSPITSSNFHLKKQFTQHYRKINTEKLQRLDFKN